MPKHGVPDSDDTGVERVREAVRNRPYQENPGRQAGRVALTGGDGAEARLIGREPGGALFAILAGAASCITPRLRSSLPIVPGCLGEMTYVPVVSLGLRDVVHR